MTELTADEVLELIEQLVKYVPDTLEEARLGYENIADLVKSHLGPNEARKEE